MNIFSFLYFSAVRIKNNKYLPKICRPNMYKPIRTRLVGDFQVCVPADAALRMFIMQVVASRNTELVDPPLFWPVNCIKLGRGMLNYCLLSVL